MKDDDLLEAVRGAVIREMWKIAPQGLSNTVWASAPRGVKDDALLEAMRVAAIRKI